MDVTVHIDEVVVGRDGPDRDGGVTASLRPTLGGVLDAQELGAVESALIRTVLDAVPERQAPPGSAS